MINASSLPNRSLFSVTSAIWFLIILLVLDNGCRTHRFSAADSPYSEEISLGNNTTDFSQQSTWILGYFEPGRLFQLPHSEWYKKGFDSYEPDQKYIDLLKKESKENISITVVLGTWCPDSRREFPRFMRIIEILGFPSENITLIGTDDQKVAPIGDYESLDILRVPTFIFYRNKVETGRIIENPLTSLEQDMTEILDRDE